MQLQLRRVDALSPSPSLLPASISSAASPWGLLTPITATLGIFASLLSNVSINGSTIGGKGASDEEGEDADPLLVGASADKVDAEHVMREGKRVLCDFAKRVEEADAGTTLLCDPSAESEGTELDAVVFALLHTILSLPLFEQEQAPEEGNDAGETERTLRLLVQQNPNLLKWVRSMYIKHVRPFDQ